MLKIATKTISLPRNLNFASVYPTRLSKNKTEIQIDNSINTESIELSVGFLKPSFFAV